MKSLWDEPWHDETSLSASILGSRMDGRAPRGNGWLIRSHMATGKPQLSYVGLRYNGVTAPFTLDGAMDGPHFLAYIDQILAPTLKKGDIVFMDNVSTHLVDGVEEAIETRGARVFYLPPYSPDFNPIEQLFAKLKSFLRKAKARTVEGLWKAIASFLKTVSKGECKAYLANSGYA
jgi:transposase